MARATPDDSLLPRFDRALSSAGRQLKIVPVTLAERHHPFPSRTRKLSSPAPKILGGQPPGKIGRRRDISFARPAVLPTGRLLSYLRGSHLPAPRPQGEARSVIDGVDGGHRCHAEAPPGPRPPAAGARLPHRRARAMRSLSRYVGRHDGVRRSIQHRRRPRDDADGPCPEPAWRGIAGRRGRRRPARCRPSARPPRSWASAASRWPPACSTPARACRNSTRRRLDAFAHAVGAAEPDPLTDPDGAPVPSPDRRRRSRPQWRPPPPTEPPRRPRRRSRPIRCSRATRWAHRAALRHDRRGIQAANGIQDPNEIFIGQVLVIPSAPSERRLAGPTEGRRLAAADLAKLTPAARARLTPRRWT